MKVEQQGKMFIPITITLESQEEVDRVFALFNHSTITRIHPLYKKFYNELTAYKTRDGWNGYAWEDVLKVLDR